MSDPDEFFKGASRKPRFSEEVAQHEDSSDDAPTPAVTRQTARSLRDEFTSRNRSAIPPKPEEPTRGLLRIGYKKRRAVYEAELKAWEVEVAEDVVRGGVWPRPMMVTVMNLKGGSGKTPTNICTAAAMATARRDGSVAVWEATDERGTLLNRAEGHAKGGLVEMLDAHTSGDITSSAALKSFGVTQSSGATVFGSVGDRRVFSGTDIETLYLLIGEHYPVSVVDSSNVSRSSAFTTAVGLSDAIIIPSLCTWDAIAGALDTFEAVTEPDPHRLIPQRAELRDRIVMVLTHDVPDENLESRQAAIDILDSLEIQYVEIPFDPHIRNGQEIVYERLSEESKEAWLLVAAAVTRMLDRAAAE